MNVAELIKSLQSLPPNAKVVVEREGEFRELLLTDLRTEKTSLHLQDADDEEEGSFVIFTSWG